jgi:tetratricopeptide (TPR) repeat protein
MKRAAILVAMLTVAAVVFARQQPGAQTPPATKPGVAQPGAAQPGAAQPGAAQPGAGGAAGQGAAPTQTLPQTPPQGKRPPQAKTQPEFDAYKVAMASANDPAAMEKAADDFATKFPDSELRVLLYRSAMHSYQAANNADKMMEMGQKVLKIDPDDPEALIGAAEVLAERTRDTDLDKDQRLDEAMKMAQHALETVDTDIGVPAGTPQEKIDAYKGFLKSSAYSIIGTLQFNKEKYPEAESYFRKSIDALPTQPDPIAVLRLALSLDKQNRYPEALKEANHAVELTDESTPAGSLARRERDRLVQLTGGSSPAPTTKPPSSGATPNPAPPQK